MRMKKERLGFKAKDCVKCESESESESEGKWAVAVAVKNGWPR